MSDLLQTWANIIQIVGGVWVLCLGSKTVFDLIKRLQQKQPLHLSLSKQSPLKVLSSPFVTNLLSIVILVLLILTYFRSVGSPSQAMPIQQSSNSTGSTQSRNSASATAIGTPTATASIPPSPEGAATALAGTTQKNFRLSCTCDDPIVLTINTITIDSNKGNMTWNISFNNVSGKIYDVYLDDFHLETLINGDRKTYNATGDVTGPSSPIGSLGSGIRPGQVVPTSVIFSFIPFINTQYTLKAHIANNGNDFTFAIDFDPYNMTF